MFESMNNVDLIVNSVLSKLAQARGIVVMQWDFCPPLNGLYLKSGDHRIPPCIALDERLSGAKQNQVMAHELGHHQMHQGDGDLLFSRDQSKVVKAEKQADAFADILIDAIMLAFNEGRNWHE